MRKSWCCSRRVTNRPKVVERWAQVSVVCSDGKASITLIISRNSRFSAVDTYSRSEIKVASAENTSWASPVEQDFFLPSVRKSKRAPPSGYVGHPPGGGLVVAHRILNSRRPQKLPVGPPHESRERHSTVAGSVETA